MMNRGRFARGKALTEAGLTLAVTIALAACDRDKAPVYTLYQSNPPDLTARLRFATFDKPEEPSPRAKADKPINQRNCEMTANVLNNSIRAANGGPLMLRYWCEAGPYRAKTS